MDKMSGLKDRAMSDLSELVTCSIYEFVGSLSFTFLACFIIGITGTVGNAELDFESLSTGAVLAISIGTALSWFTVSYVQAMVSQGANGAVKTRIASESSGKQEVFAVGHINPVITFAACLCGQISPAVALIYTIAQFVGAVVAMVILMLCNINSMYLKLGVSYLGEDATPTQGFLVEGLLTFMFVLTILKLKLYPTSSSSLTYGQQKKLTSGLVSNDIFGSITDKLKNDSRSPAKVYRSLVKGQEQVNGEELEGNTIDAKLAYGPGSFLVNYLADEDTDNIVTTILQSLDTENEGYLSYLNFSKLYIMEKSSLTDDVSANSTFTDSCTSALVMFVLTLVGIGLTGASMNTARSFGGVIFTGAWRYHWVFWSGPYAGALFAATCAKQLSSGRELKST